MEYTQIGDDNNIYNIDSAHNVNFYVRQQGENIRDTFANISTCLTTYRNYFTEGIHIKRPLTDSLYNFCNQDVNTENIRSKIAVVKGGAGLGKSVVMRDLLERLSFDNEIGVLGIKADKVVSYSGIAKDIIGTSTPLIDLIKRYAMEVKRFVLIVDQIDALSQSMSNDRSAIVHVDNLIKMVTQLPNAKIVISCRPYDLQYDSILEEYSRYSSFELKRLTEEEIKDVLERCDIKSNNIGPKLLSFLATPLHLYLFCRLNSKELQGEDITLQKMYDKIWSEYVIKEPLLHGYKIDETISLMETLANNMFDKQCLSIDHRPYEDKYNEELSLLTTNGILTKDNNLIQFFHQSFFDYTYARLFVSSGKSLTKELNKAHQGLFIRQRVKQILTYERGYDEDTYYKHLEEIFYSGRSYRYHIKMLVLTTIGTFNQILPCEKDFIENKILKDKQLSRVFIESILSREWFNFFVRTDYCIDAIKSKDDEKLKLILSLCERMLYLESDTVIQYMDNELCSIDSGEVIKSIAEIINRNSTEQNCIQLESLYEKVYDTTQGITMPFFLMNLLKLDKKFVIKELEKDLLTKLSFVKQDDMPLHIPIDHTVQEIYKRLCEENDDNEFDLLYVSLLKIQEHCERKAKFTNGKVRYSSHYMFYVKKEPYRYDFHYTLADNMFDLVEKKAKEEPKWLEQRVSRLKESTFSLFYQILFAGYANNATFFKDDIFKILTDVELLEDFYLSNATYYATLMLKASFDFFSEEEKEKIIVTILKLAPEIEKTPIKDLHKYGYSLTSFGRLAGQYLNVLGDEKLQKFQHARRVYHKLLDKYKDLKCEPPRVQTQMGWISIPKENRKKMTDREIMQSLLAFPLVAEIGKPDATGTNIAFGKDAEENPTRYAAIIDNILNDSRFSFSSISEGIQGLMRAGYDEAVIESFFHREISRIKNISEMDAANIMTMVRMTEHFIKQEKLPVFVLNFICDVLTQYPDNDEDDGHFEPELFNTGINRVNGCAGHYLVKCCSHKDYEEKIFGTIERIATTASALTRSAILLEMRLLCNLDADRTRKLYLMLMHDYDVRLMALPIHDYNPILTFIGSHFKDIIPLVEKCIEQHECHRVISLFLWLAYYNDSENAKDYLCQVLKKSDEAKVEVLQYISKNRNEKTKNYIDEFFYQFLNSDSKEVGDEYNILFHYLKTWSTNDMKVFVTAYSKSRVSIYATNDVYNFFEREASIEPRLCMESISNIYQLKKKQEHYYIRCVKDSQYNNRGI